MKFLFLFPTFSRTNKSDSVTTASSKFTVPSDYNTVDLRRELTQFGDSPGPITKSTKYLYMKRLMKFKRNPELVNSPSNNQSKLSKSFVIRFSPKLNKTKNLILHHLLKATQLSWKKL